VLDGVQLVLAGALLVVLEIRGKAEVPLPGVGELALELLALDSLAGRLLLRDAGLQARFDWRFVFCLRIVRMVLSGGHHCPLLTKRAMGAKP
jgi:hypothetical protein